MIIFYLIILVILFIAVLILCLWTGLSVIGIFLTTVPFVPVPSHIIDTVAKEIGSDTSPVLYDLGCGDGKVLFKLAKLLPHGKFVGIEIAPWPYLLAWLQQKIKQEKHVTIIRGDIFTHDFSDATHVFTFLLSNANERLLPVLRKKCNKGTTVFVCDFPFKDLEPTKVISFDHTKFELGRKLYIYTL